jgi:hypothetical protein
MTTLASPEIRALQSATSSAANGEIYRSPGLDLTNPATGEPLGQSPSGSAAEVDAAVAAVHAAFTAWSAAPSADRIQSLFKLKAILEDRFDELAAIITTENGKTLAESKGELRRGIENVEVACGIPVLMQGYSLEDVAPGIDDHGAPAARRRHHHQALQLPADDPAVVSPLTPSPLATPWSSSPAKLASLCNWRVRSSRETVAKSLEGDYRPEHLFTLRQSLVGYRFYQKLICEVDQELELRMHALPRAEGAPEQMPLRTKAWFYQRAGNEPAFDLKAELFRIAGAPISD